MHMTKPVAVELRCNATALIIGIEINGAISLMAFNLMLVFFDANVRVRNLAAANLFFFLGGMPFIVTDIFLRGSKTFNAKLMSTFNC